MGAGEVGGVAFPGAEDVGGDFLERAAVGEDDGAGAFVDRFAGGVEGAEAFPGVFDFEERAVAVAGGAGEDGFEGGVEADDDAFGAEEVEHAGLDDEAAAAGDDGAGGRVAAFDEVAFEGAEGGFAGLGENLGDGAALGALDFVVAVEHRETGFLGEGAADGGLAGAHEAHEVEVDVGGLHAGEATKEGGNAAGGKRGGGAAGLRRRRAVPYSRQRSMNYAWASDNTAGICPEALEALTAANAGRAASYGDDPWTAEAKRRFDETFECACTVHFVFNGTAANALALAALGQRHHATVCHALAHVETDECGAPEFFTGGGKLLPVEAPGAKLTPEALAPVLQRGHGVHFPRLRTLSLTQATELGTVYTPEELRALGGWARAHGLAVHVDGARFANAAAALAERGVTPADLTWRAGVDVLCFGGTKNGLLGTEAVVFFDPERAREFEYRVKQGGQLASKQRFAGAQWAAVLRDGVWLRRAAHANAQARRLARGFAALGWRLATPTEANGVFVELAPAVAAALAAKGWQFYPFGAPNVYRFMGAWNTAEADVETLLADAAAAAEPAAGR